MALLQNDPVAPPTAGDTNLQDFSEIVQRNFEELFQLAHQHPVRTTLPEPTEGAIGDINLYDDGIDVYVLVKTSRGWFRTVTLIAV